MKKFNLFFVLAAVLVVSAASDKLHSGQKNTQSGSDPLQMQAQTPFIPGQVCVKFKQGIGPFSSPAGPVAFSIQSLDEKASRYEVSSLVRRFRHRPIPEKSGLPDLSRIHLITFPEKYHPMEVARAFALDPHVEYAEPVYRHAFDAVPNDPMYSQLFHLPQIMAEQAWDIHKGELGTQQVVVAIIDGGVDWLHPDLRANIWQNLGEDADGDGHVIEYVNGQWVLDPGDLDGIDNDGNGYPDDLIGWDFYDFSLTGNGSNPDPTWGSPTQNHGSHVAGIAAAKTNNGAGIASISWNVKYMPVQTDIGNNTLIYGYDGIIYAAENGADIINCSWGSNVYSQADADAVAYAVGLGSILICSGGNTNINQVRFPSGYPGVFATASVNSIDQKATYSSYGIHIDIAAPGGDVGMSILSTLPYNSYGGLMGTSMASPLAAGLAALIKSYHPEWTREQVLLQLIGTCDDIDPINPGYPNCFGGGRINAYHALTDTAPQAPQYLKMSLYASDFIDLDGDGIIAQGDTASVSLTLWNHASFSGSENAQITLHCDNPDVILLENTATVDIPADNMFPLTNAFEFRVSETCPPQFLEFYLTFDAGMPVVFGDSIPLSCLVAPDGIFVYEGEEGHFDYSGSYIRMFLEDIGQPVLYSNTFPNSFRGFDMVFLSHGNYGQALTEGSILTHERSMVLQDYAEQGGMIYAEMSGLMMGASYFTYPNLQELMEIFGIAGYVMNMVQNPIDTLTGIAGTPLEGMEFTHSYQVNNWYIDELTAVTGASCTFTETDYTGGVAIMNDGSYGQKTFYFGYALAELQDVDAHSSRYNILLQIMQFFGYEPDSAYVIANFTSDSRGGAPGEIIHFKDISLTDEGFTVNSWQWDFNGDGIIDSEESEPEWTYETGGKYDVMLIASNGTVTDTMIYPDYILINRGMLVFEGVADGKDYSGAYIRDFLLASSYDVTYLAGVLPSSFLGFDAVFLSFGNYGNSSTVMTDDMANLVLTYLAAGGQVYLEGGDALGYDQVNNTELLTAFGLLSASDGSSNAIDQLLGQNGSIMEGIHFTGTNQLAQTWIDQYVPGDGVAAFEEVGYAIVGVQNGTQSPGLPPRTFCFSYALAELKDDEAPNTREEVMWRLLNFFGLITGVEEPAAALPAELPMNVFPNPVSGRLNVSFELPGDAIFSLDILDITGRQVMALEDKRMAAGKHSCYYNLGSLETGVYLLRLKAGDAVIAKKLIIQ